MVLQVLDSLDEPGTDEPGTASASDMPVEKQNLEPELPMTAMTMTTTG